MICKLLDIPTYLPPYMPHATCHMSNIFWSRATTRTTRQDDCSRGGTSKQYWSRGLGWSSGSGDIKVTSYIRTYGALATGKRRKVQEDRMVGSGRVGSSQVTFPVNLALRKDPSSISEWKISAVFLAAASSCRR